MASTLAISSLAINQASADDKNKNEIRNVIFLIGDGMGPTYTSAYRAYKDDKKLL